MNVLPRNTILAGDARERLSGLLSESVDCVITSPPYYRLRDYADAPGQLGQERTVDGWVANLRGVFGEVGRVLKPHGSVWLNVGDGYSRHRSWGAPPRSSGARRFGWAARIVTPVRTGRTPATFRRRC